MIVFFRGFEDEEDTDNEEVDDDEKELQMPTVNLFNELEAGNADDGQSGGDVESDTEPVEISLHRLLLKRMVPRSYRVGCVVHQLQLVINNMCYRVGCVVHQLKLGINK